MHHGPVHFLQNLGSLVRHTAKTLSPILIRHKEKETVSHPASVTTSTIEEQTALFKTYCKDCLTAVSRSQCNKAETALTAAHKMLTSSPLKENETLRKKLEEEYEAAKVTLENVFYGQERLHQTDTLNAITDTLTEIQTTLQSWEDKPASAVIKEQDNVEKLLMKNNEALDRFSSYLKSKSPREQFVSEDVIKDLTAEHHAAAEAIKRRCAEAVTVKKQASATTSRLDKLTHALAALTEIPQQERSTAIARLQDEFGQLSEVWKTAQSRFKMKWADVEKVNRYFTETAGAFVKAAVGDTITEIETGMREWDKKPASVVLKECNGLKRLLKNGREALAVISSHLSFKEIAGAETLTKLTKEINAIASTLETRHGEASMLNTQLRYLNGQLDLLGTALNASAEQTLRDREKQLQGIKKEFKEMKQLLKDMQSDYTLQWAELDDLNSRFNETSDALNRALRTFEAAKKEALAEAKRKQEIEELKAYYRNSIEEEGKKARLRTNSPVARLEGAVQALSDCIGLKDLILRTCAVKTTTELAKLAADKPELTSLLKEVEELDSRMPGYKTFIEKGLKIADAYLERAYGLSNRREAFNMAKQVLEMYQCITRARGIDVDVRNEAQDKALTLLEILRK